MASQSKCMCTEAKIFCDWSLRLYSQWRFSAIDRDRNFWPILPTLRIMRKLECLGMQSVIDVSFSVCFFSTWGRVWVHHLSLSSGHRRNSNGWWLSCPVPWFIKTVNSVYPEFMVIHSFVFIYICQQIEKNWVGHCWTGMGSGKLKLYLSCTGLSASLCVWWWQTELVGPNQGRIQDSQ